MIQVYIYTSLYPYSSLSEAFLATELELIDPQRFEITVVPVRKERTCRIVPQYIKVDNSICDISRINKITAFIKCFSTFSLTGFSISHFVDSIKYLYAANLVYDDIVRRDKKNIKKIFYSYWLSYTPIAFAKYKKLNRGSNSIFIARGHGSDIYSVDAGVYYPLRSLSFNSLDCVFLVSNYGINYLQDKYRLPKSKLHLARLGVSDNYQPKPKEDTVIRFVSCSSIIPLKRVELIYKSLLEYSRKHTDKKFEWNHFGAGPMFDYVIKLKSQNFSPNLKVVMKGACSNNDVLSFYREYDISAFIILSVSEGIPVSIMEAISSGIPVVATNVGGVNEIVNEKTGVLLEKDFVQKDFDDALDYVLANKAELVTTAHTFFLQHYSAENNFADFYNELEELYNL